MSDIKDRMKFNSGTDKVTKSVADAVSDVLNSGQTPKSRYEQQAELMGYPTQEKPEVAESFTRELQELRKAVNDDKKRFVMAARQAKKDGKKFILNGKKTFVIDGASADLLIVLARTSGNKGESSGLTLFLVDSNDNGIEKIKLDICVT